MLPLCFDHGKVTVVLPAAAAVLPSGSSSGGGGGGGDSDEGSSGGLSLASPAFDNVAVEAFGTPAAAILRATADVLLHSGSAARWLCAAAPLRAPLQLQAQIDRAGWREIATVLASVRCVDGCVLCFIARLQTLEPAMHSERLFCSCCMSDAVACAPQAPRQDQRGRQRGRR